MTEKEMDELEQTIRHPELRFGYVVQMYYQILGLPVPKQLDLIAEWFDDLAVVIRDTDGNTKEDPQYIDLERMIYVSRYHDYLYTGADKRIAQITGRLVGTSKSNLEKERRTSELIQKGISRKLSDEAGRMEKLYDHTADMLDVMDAEQMDRFHFLLYMFTLKTAETYYSVSQDVRDTELYPFDEEVFDQVIYNAFYQLMRYTGDGLLNGYLWLLLGGFLRNAAGRITRIYDSAFVPCFQQPSETGHLLDKLEYLMAPEEYESYYTGNDLDKRFPGIEWYCDFCGEHLNEQQNFNDHLPYWQCRRCGYINPISSERIYKNTEDWQNGIRNMSEENFHKAIENRKKEIEEQMTREEDQDGGKK